MRNYVSLDYTVAGINEDEQVFEKAVARSQHLNSIFVLFQCLDLSRFEDDIEALEFALTNIGVLGEAISGGLLFELDELNKLKNKPIDSEENNV